MAETYAVEFFDKPRVTLAASDYAQYFTGISYREAGRAASALREIAAVLAVARADTLEMIAGAPAEMTARLEAEYDSWATAHLAHMLGWVRGHGNLMSSMIAGPANFPVARQQKRNASHDRRYQQIKIHRAAYLKRIKRIRWPHGAPGEAIRSNNPDAIELVRKEIAEREAWHAAAKQQNAAARKAKAPRPFEAWALSNNLANIKRYQDRLAGLEAMAATPTAAPVEIHTAAGIVERVENTDEARIQLIFPAKPDTATRSILKSNGFRWAPSQGAWQRHLNANGRYAANRVVAALTAHTGET